MVRSVQLMLTILLHRIEISILTIETSLWRALVLGVVQGDGYVRVRSLPKL